MKKISVEKKEQVKALLKTSMTGYEVAEIAEVSTATVNKIRKELEQQGFDIWHKTDKEEICNKVSFFFSYCSKWQEEVQKCFSLKC